jgi:prepilin-type N-terminal cleavage/methylation domain-containing protein
VRPEAVALKILPMRRIREHTSAFTLIELLVVMTLIAILLGIGYPAFTSVMESARKTQAKNEEQQIVAAVNAYYTDYGKYPLPVGAAADTTYGAGGTSNGELFYTLRAVNGGTMNAGDLANPRKIVFIQPPVSKDQTNPRSGINTTTSVWYDPWGSPYNIAIDENYNNIVCAPNYTDLATTYVTPTPPDGSGDVGVRIGVISWCFGKNGALGGGPAAPGPPAFTAEGGSVNNFSASGDVISWQ